jgi:zinc/manganese transport system substrate-binding protein
MRTHFRQFVAGACLLLAGQAVTAKLQVFSCEPEWKALAEEIGGELVDATSATTAFQDPHFIEARPSLIVKARRADLVFCTGAELEAGWLPLLLRRSGNASIQPGGVGYFMAAEQVSTIEKPEELSRSLGDVHAAGNPHVHLDPNRLLTIAKTLSERLAVLQPNNAKQFQQGYIQFEQRWLKAMAEWEQRAKALNGKAAIVHHKSFSYLLKWLQVEAVADLEPKPGLPPTTAHLAELVALTKTTPPHFILVANYHDSKGAEWLADKTGIDMIKLPYTVGGSEKAMDLFTLFDTILSELGV